MYPDARHAFDVPDLPPLTRLANGAPIGHHPESAAAAREEVRALPRPVGGLVRDRPFPGRPAPSE